MQTCILRPQIMSTYFYNHYQLQKNIVCFCFYLLKQHKHNFEKDSGGSVVRRQELLLSCAPSELVLEEKLGRLI